MTKQEILDHLATYANATIYLELMYFVDFSLFPTRNTLNKENFIEGLTNLPDAINISIEADTKNDLKITNL